MELDISLVDFPFVCRICLARGELRLFKEEDCLWDLFLAITKIDVSSTVNFPRNICNECINKLQDILVFIDVSKYNDLGSEKKMVFKTESIEYPETFGSETYQEAFEYKEDIALQIFQYCRICSSPRSLILCEEKSSLMELFRTITNIDVETDMNICNKCVNKLEKISSFMDLLFCNNGKLHKAISGNEAIKTESYSDGNAVDIGSSRRKELKIYLHRNKVVKSSGDNSCPHESNDKSAMIDIKEEKFDRELVIHIEQNYQNRSDLGSQNQFGKTIFDLQHTKETRFKCDSCKISFSYESRLKQHMLFHTGERPFKCDSCKKQFAQMDSLKRHWLIHTGEKPFKCDSCEKRYTQANHLKQHMLTHTGEKPFKCDSCEKRFNHKVGLQQHLLSHSGERPFKCENCGRSFSLKGSLRQHMLIHTGEKPFTCNICKKSFALKGNWKQHLRTHTGEKPFKCDCCEKRFNLATHLKLHMFTHTGEKPFKCDSCERQFTRAVRLNQHMLTHARKKRFKCNSTFSLALVEGHSSAKVVEEVSLSSMKLARSHRRKAVRM